MGMVHRGGNAVPFHGDHHPVSIYVGDKPIFEPTDQAQDGKTLTFENTYNDVAEVTVFGESTQDGEPTPEAPVPIESIKSVELVSRNADGNKSATRTIDLQGHELRSLPYGTRDELLVHRDGRVELVQRVGYRLVDKFDYASSWGANLIFMVFLYERIVETTNITSEANFNRALCSIGLTNAYKVYYGKTNKPGYIVHDIFNNSSSSKYLMFFFPNLGSLEDANEYVAGNPIDVQFVLDTPQTIQLPSIDPMPTYYPYTFVDGNGADISARVRVFQEPTSKMLGDGGD